MTRVDSDLSQKVGQTLPVVGLCVVLVATAGCSSREDPAQPNPPASTPSSSQPPADDGFLATLTAALSEGQLTLNNRWTQEDLNREKITDPIRYEGTRARVDRVRSYTTLIQQYRVRRKQCEEDSLTLYPPATFSLGIGPFPDIFYFQDRKCYPTLTFPPNGLTEIVTPGVDPIAWRSLHRYGYYCGGGMTPFAAFVNGAPEPLDGVDYCCRLHDEKAWGEFPASECGIMMCLSKASGLPANVIAQLPDVETARQHWYQSAGYACPGDQLNNTAPPPIPGP